MVKPPQLKICEADKYRLARLKGLTGITTSNVLCRWAFCLSLRVEGRPQFAPVDTAQVIEWETFGGDCSPLYLALLTERCHRDGLALTTDVLGEELRQHVHRGTGYMLDSVKNAVDLARLAWPKGAA